MLIEVSCLEKCRSHLQNRVILLLMVHPCLSSGLKCTMSSVKDTRWDVVQSAIDLAQFMSLKICIFFFGVCVAIFYSGRTRTVTTWSSVYNLVHRFLISLDIVFEGALLFIELLFPLHDIFRVPEGKPFVLKSFSTSSFFNTLTVLFVLY